MPKLNVGGVGIGTLGKRSISEFIADEMTTYAAALAYHVLFALFPFLLFLVALMGFLDIPDFFDWLLDQARAALPQQAVGQVEEVVNEIRDEQGGLLSFGIILALWTASSGVRSLMNALNKAYDVEEDRPIWKRYPLSILYTVGLAIMLIVATGLMLIGPQLVGWLARQIGMGDVFVTLWAWFRLPTAVILLMLALAVIYYVAPNVDQPFRFITPGSVLAVIVWVLASLGFSYYVSNLADYSATYGSLGAVIVLLFYFFISSSVLLLGAELNAEVYRASKGKEKGEDKG